MGPKAHHNGEIFVGDLFVDLRFMCFSFQAKIIIIINK
jgi:hypothetical protein